MSHQWNNHIIRLENLAIGYQKHHALLKNINLTVSPGEMVALIGRNGTGKSTLLKSILGLIPLIDGACFLDGAPFHTYDFRHRARKVSYVSSHFSHLPSISVRELVSLGRMPHTGFMGRLSIKDRELIERALEEVWINPLADRKVEHLSDGERQRTMIARALAQDTPLMLLDEPTAFLDIPNKFELIRLLNRFRSQGKSIVYSTHDLDTAMHHADKIWVIHQDEILEGAPEDLGIQGLFDILFESSGIKYDHLAGRFKYDRFPIGFIQLEGAAGKELSWTKTALERIGYQVDVTGSIQIKVDLSASKVTWTVLQSNQRHEFYNLYSLVRFLINHD